jgi:hypothetical protein
METKVEVDEQEMTREEEEYSNDLAETLTFHDLVSLMQLAHRPWERPTLEWPIDELQGINPIWQQVPNDMRTAGLAPASVLQELWVRKRLMEQDLIEQDLEGGLCRLKLTRDGRNLVDIVLMRLGLVAAE